MKRSDMRGRHRPRAPPLPDFASLIRATAADRAPRARELARRPSRRGWRPKRTRRAVRSPHERSDMRGGLSCGTAAPGCRCAHPGYVGQAIPRSERLRQPGLAQNRICGVAARNPDGNGEIPLRDRAMPDLVAAPALPHQSASGGAQLFSQRAIKLWSH